MTIGVLTIQIYISNSLSLKHKRMVTRSLKDRLRETFNVSVAELDDHDKWQKTVFGISVIGREKKQVNSVLDHVLDFLRKDGDISISDYEVYLL